ncbi:pyridoxamine 5'-phosphate oxidase family protein [Virgibacillus siamensis]|uniref:pyridoxamine 5'-phosphate oxidase family protein n=1 Tax=Virgibacillus siamensis TaxID=480071 RepID=UPI001FE3907E|nr:pyridoxamine 5'-phosphate oxidase family protein [Virgibacillus siamensis]
MVFWKDECLWIIGTPEGTFPLRVDKHPICAIGIVDFDHTTGKVLHAGFRGKATVEPFNYDLAKLLLTKYLGLNEMNWDSRFKYQDPQNVFIRFKPDTIVVRDQSYIINDG